MIREAKTQAVLTSARLGSISQLFTRSSDALGLDEFIQRIPEIYSKSPNTLMSILENSLSACQRGQTDGWCSTPAEKISKMAIANLDKNIDFAFEVGTFFAGYRVISENVDLFIKADAKRAVGMLAEMVKKGKIGDVSRALPIAKEYFSPDDFTDIEAVYADSYNDLSIHYYLNSDTVGVLSSDCYRKIIDSSFLLAEENSSYSGDGAYSDLANLSLQLQSFDADSEQAKLAGYISDSLDKIGKSDLLITLPVGAVQKAARKKQAQGQDLKTVNSFLGELGIEQIHPKI